MVVPSEKAKQEVRTLTADTDYVREVTELLGVSGDLECHLVPVMFFSSREQRYGFHLDLADRKVVFLCFGYEGFDDAEVDGKSRQWLRLGCYHHVAQAILLPFFPEAHDEVMRTEALVEPLRGLPSFMSYGEWYAIFCKHVVGAVSSVLERRCVGEHAYRYLERFHAGSGMLYLRFIMQELERILAERQPLEVMLKQLALRLYTAREELLEEASRLPYLGSIKECEMPYWTAAGAPQLYVAGPDEEGRLTETARRLWGEVERVDAPTLAASRRPSVYYGPASDPTIKSLLAQADITVAPSFIRVGQSTYFGSNLHLLVVGQPPSDPSSWWAVHCAWEAEDIQGELPLGRLGADYAVMSHGQLIGEGDYIIERIHAR